MGLVDRPYYREKQKTKKLDLKRYFLILVLILLLFSIFLTYVAR